MSQTGHCRLGIIGFILAIGLCPPLAAAKTLIFGGDSYYPPYHYLDDQGRPRGLDIHIMEALAEELNLTVEYRLQDWSATLADLRQSRLDIVPMFVTQTRRARFKFSAPLLSRYHLLFATRGSHSVTSLDELAGASIAVQRGGLAHDYLVSLGMGDQIILVGKEPQAITAIKEGVADYALVPQIVGFYKIYTTGWDHIVAISPPLLVVDYAFAFPNDTPQALIDQVNESLGRLRRQGIFDDLYRSFLANIYVQSPVVTGSHGYSSWVILALALLVVALIVFIVLYWRRLQMDMERLTDKLDALKAERGFSLEQHHSVGDSGNNPDDTLPDYHRFIHELETRLTEPNGPGGMPRVMALDVLDLDMIRQVGSKQLTDQLLQQVHSRLAGLSFCRYIATLGYGRFLLILDNTTDPLPDTFFESITRPVTIDDTPLDVRVAGGWSCYPQDAADAEDLVCAAELARIRAGGRGIPLLRFHADMRPSHSDMDIILEMRRAIQAGTMSWYFQPQYDLKTNAVTGAEMLVRWTHPQWGYMSPDSFIPIAEKTNTINELTGYLFKCLDRYLGDLQERDASFRLSVNVSGNDLADPQLIDALLNTLNGNGHRLVLEVTETAIMHDMEACLDNMTHLREAGVRIALDDFGTGFSSLTLLKNIQPEEVKIDCSFVQSMHRSTLDQEIVKHSIRLSHKLGAVVTAEGVEDYSALRLLRQFGCERAQGYGLSHPMPWPALRDLLDTDITRTVPVRAISNST